MLVKVRFGASQKFVKITELSLKEFLSAAFLKFGIQTEPENVTVVDESGTEVDEDVFEDVVKDPSIGILIIKPGPASPVQSHQSSSIDSTHSNHTLNIEGSPGTKRIRLHDEAKKEHYYDGESGTEYLAWGIKTIQRGLAFKDLDSGSPLSSSLDSMDSDDPAIKKCYSSQKTWWDDEAKKLVETILVGTPGGRGIINEYNRTMCLKDQTRRKMVNILAADMIQNNGTSPPRQVKEKYARGIVALFPNLSDPYSKNGYEHYYDGESGTGYLAWRIKTIQRGLAKERKAPCKDPDSPLSSSIYSDDPVSKENSSSQRTRLDDEAKKLVETILVGTPGGRGIINEYNQTMCLKDQTRRKMVNILAADMIQNNGTSPPRQVKENYARGIVALFPNLSDPYSKSGYEHYYDGESGTGYLAWRIKTIQRSLAKERRASHEGSVESITVLGCPSGQRSRAEEVLWFAAPTIKQEPALPPVTAVHQEPMTPVTEDQCNEAISFMNQCCDEDAVRKKMILTFEYRHNMLSRDILTVFPRFKDIKGLIEQDFILLFGADVSGRLLDKWTTTFKEKVIEQCKKHPIGSDVLQLLMAAEPPADVSEEDTHLVWDSDLASILLLLHLIPPCAQGRKRPGKMSASQAERHLVVFKRGTDVDTPLRDVTVSAHPYLLAVGPQKSLIQRYFIVLHQHAIPCMSTSSLGAFDELFKAHFVFGTPYNAMLHNMYTFLQTTVYNIGIGKVKERPRVAEVRARLLS